MKKIPCIFMTDRVRHEVDLTQRNEQCDWVWEVPHDWIATRKWDGSACLWEGGKLYKRRCVKATKTAPLDFRPCSIDNYTNKMFGWVPCTLGPEDKHHWNGFDNLCSRFYETGSPPPDGTYELCGPMINGNPEGLAECDLIKHGSGYQYTDTPVHSAEWLAQRLAKRDIEGLVFKHRDGRMAKIRKKDFGLRRKP